MRRTRQLGGLDAGAARNKAIDPGTNVQHLGDMHHHFVAGGTVVRIVEFTEFVEAEPHDGEALAAEFRPTSAARP